MITDIFITLGISVAINMFFFIFAFILKKDVFTDITYALSFLSTTLVVMLINKSYNLTQWLIFILVLLWSLRLGSFLFIRILKVKVDHRFDKMRNIFWKFGAFWLLQTITVWLVNMPTYIVLLDHDQTFSFYLLIPFALAIFFLAFETVADFQKFFWNNKHQGEFIHTGLWKISRHPNYFGEMAFWWMLMVFSLIGNYQNINLMSLIGPLYITLSLYKISGLPLLEKIGWKKFSHLQAYQEYLSKTPTLLPLIGRNGVKKIWTSKTSNSTK